MPQYIYTCIYFIDTRSRGRPSFQYSISLYTCTHQCFGISQSVVRFSGLPRCDLGATLPGNGRKFAFRSPPPFFFLIIRLAWQPIIKIMYMLLESTHMKDCKGPGSKNSTKMMTIYPFFNFYRNEGGGGIYNRSFLSPSFLCKPSYSMWEIRRAWVWIHFRLHSM